MSLESLHKSLAGEGRYQTEQGRGVNVLSLLATTLTETLDLKILIKNQFKEHREEITKIQKVVTSHISTLELTGIELVKQGSLLSNDIAPDMEAIKEQLNKLQVDTSTRIAKLNT